MSQLLLSQHWLCSIDFTYLLQCQLFWDSVQSTNFWHWISGHFCIVYCWVFFTSSFWNCCFYCWSCLDGSFLLPSRGSSSAQRYRELLIRVSDITAHCHGNVWELCSQQPGFLQELYMWKDEIRGSINIHGLCTHRNVCKKKKKELWKNAKARNPEVIWVLCLRRGLEAEENSTLCVS